MKKKILMGLGLVSVALLSLGGTVAYLTDTDSTVDAYTIGEINVDLLTDETLGGTDGLVRLMPGQQNKVNPDAKISNVGANDAYVWLTVKVPSSLDKLNTAATNILHWNMSGKYLDTHYKDDVTYEETWRLPVERNTDDISTKVDGKEVAMPVVTADGQFVFETDVVVEDNVEYHVYTFLYNGVLAAGKTTGTIINGAFLDQRVDYNNELGKWTFVENGVETVLEHDFSKDAAMVIEAYAIQADGFDSVDAAYAAYHNQWDQK